MSKPLTVEDVAKVAKLARLALTAEEQERFADQMADILKYVDMLDEVDTSEIEALAHPFAVENVFRPDETRPSLDRNDALQNAPQADGKFFLVPQILEGA